MLPATPCKICEENTSQSIDYIRIKALQDRILSAMAGQWEPFYLSGGAALSNFYLQHRHTPDLDFYVNHDQNFRQVSGGILNKLKKQFTTRDEKMVKVANYLRIYVADDAELKIALVNQLAAYPGPVLKAGVVSLDTVENILCNKMQAILRRGSPADFFDIYCIASAYDFQWGYLFERALRMEVMNQVKLLMMLSHEVNGYHKLLKGCEPDNLFDFMGIKPPMMSDQIFISVFHDEHEVTREPGQQKAMTSLQEFATELKRVADELNFFLNLNPCMTAGDLRHIRAVINFNWKGAFICVQRCKLITKEDLADRVCTFLVDQLDGMAWLKTPLNPEDLKEKFNRMAKDLLLAGPNSLGSGKTSIKEAKPVS